MKIHFIYVTTSSAREARRIGKTLVEEKLAACVNIFPPVESIYEWEGKIESAAETVFIAKTGAFKTPGLIERIRELHSCECPCIVSFSVTEGNPAFLDWIATQTESAPSGDTAS